MTSHEDTDNTAGRELSDTTSAEDVTMAAADDVVAQIRAHAAKVRTGDPVVIAESAEELQVWTAADEDFTEPPVTIRPGPAPAEQAVAAPAGAAAVDDVVVEPVVAEQVVVEHGPAPADPTVVERTLSPGPGSLIEGVAPPASTTTFWTNATAAPASSPSALRTGAPVNGMSLGLLLGLVAALIVVASVGLALVFAVQVPVS